MRVSAVRRICITYCVIL